MADEKPAPKPADKKKDAGKKPPDKKKAPGARARLANWRESFSAAGCASCLTSVFLLALVVSVWIVFRLMPGNLPWQHAMSWWRIGLELLLVVAIPLVLYQAIRVWLEGDESPHPDIDFAWQAGIDALAQNGLTLTSAPLFVILGSASVRQEQALVRAAGLALRVHDVPEGPAPLHWFAGPDGIYLFISESCGASSLAALLEKRRAQAVALGDTSTPGDLPSFAASSTARIAAAPAPAPAARPTPRPQPGGGTRGTIMLDQFVADREVAEQQAAQAAATATAEAEPEPTMVVSTVSDQPAVLSQQESARQRTRLEYVCHLIRRERQPLCPLNGVMVLLPFELLQATQRETQQLQRTVRADLGVMQTELEARCPVTALVVGMHQERGFRELVRRVGRDRATAQRFGRRFDVKIIPSTENLTALCALVAGTFEDWIHTLFREADALTRPGNQRLYGLLCKMRATLSNVLCDVLVGALNHDPQSKELPEPVPFSGCYFAATGDSDDQQAFVRGIFEKLVEEQEDVEWTKSATSADRRYGILAAVSGGLTACILLGLAALGIWRLLA